MNCKGCRWNNGGVCNNRRSMRYDDFWREGCELWRPPLTLLQRHRCNQRRKEAVVQAYIDRRARKTGACLHCPWHTTGAACVLPRCLRPQCYELRQKEGQ